MWIAFFPMHERRSRRLHVLELMQGGPVGVTFDTFMMAFMTSHCFDLCVSTLTEDGIVTVVALRE